MTENIYTEILDCESAPDVPQILNVKISYEKLKELPALIEGILCDIDFLEKNK